MIIFICIFMAGLFAHANAAATANWQGSLPEGFSAAINVSPLDISIGETLTIEVVLTYPAAYKPEPDAMVQQLLSYEGFDAPPFYLVDKVVGSPEETGSQGQNLRLLKFSIILAPQTPGEHFIAFQTIPYTPIKAETAKGKEIIPGVFQIHVKIPKVAFQPFSLISPPMSLSQQLPVSISAENRLRFVDNNAELSKASAQSVAFMHGKKLPWQIMPALFVALTIILIVKGRVRESSENA